MQSPFIFQSTTPAFYYYRIAGNSLAADNALSALMPFSCHSSPTPDLSLLHTQAASLPDRAVIYDGPGWLSSGWRHLRHSAHGKGYRTEVENVGCLHVDDPGSRITYDDQVAALPPAQRAEALLGPPLLLAFALQSTFSLHASAVLDPAGRLLLFLGESGRGKSTLARYLGEQPGWRRVADDILPTRLDGDTLLALPHFPQLKIPPDQQPAIGLPEAIPVSAVYVVTQPEEGETAVESTPLTAAGGAFALIRHTVASRLFASDLLRRHTDFCTAAARALPAFRLTYPHRHGSLPAVRDLLTP